jgi:predicted RND superfamily exporter protein
MLRWLEQFRAYVEEDPLVVTTGSFVDQLKQVRRAVLDGREDEYRLPDSTPEAEQLLLLADSSNTAYLEDVYVQASQEGQFIMVVQDRGSKLTLPFIDKVEQYIASHPPPAGIEVRPTGTVKLAQKAYARLTEGFASSLLIAVGLIFALMVLIFRSFAWGAIALVPNVLPLIMLFGLFALLDFSVKPSLAIVFAISFGIAVDDTIHMLSVLNRLRSEGRDRDALVEGALQTSGRAIVITTLVIGSGFAILLLSEFEWIGLLGLLTPIALLGALIANLFVLPALIHIFRLSES